jgi:NADH:ubiquinone oxidoreductase subunit
MLVNAKNRRPIDRSNAAPLAPAAPASSDGADERQAEPGQTHTAEGLKGLLASERATTLEMRSAKLGVQKKLASAQADFKKLATKVQKSPPQPSAALIKGQWERAQKDLERAQIVHERESEQTEAKLAQLHEALQVSRQARSLESESRKRQTRIQIVAGVAAALLIGATIFGVVHYLHERTPTNSAREIPVESTAPEEKTETASAPNGGLSGQSGFAKGIGRLNQAFSKFPGVDPETIMRAINKKAAASGSSVCAFAWNDGQPTLQIGDGHGGSTSIEGTMTRCAEAVEHFR